jgi:uncharacterized protein (DUF362 family)/Pyruvate/2-oxoacid:ferredoxin oxidoreductase delta subunit
MEKVVIVNCKSYKQEEVDKAIKKILTLLDFPVKEYKGKKILIKPNVLGYFKENPENVVTHPALIQGLLKVFKKAKVGESSAMDTENNLRKLGFWKFKPVIFEEGKLVKVEDDSLKIMKNFYLPEIVKESDLIINLPKLKTHTLTKMTGAIKNLYGCIPGGVKQLLHREAVGEKKFSHLLVDIYSHIKPGLNIMDAVVSMEGEGPSSGTSKHTGFLLASRNAISLDIVASKMMGYRPKQIVMIKDAVKRGYASWDVKIAGDVREIPNLRFEKPNRFKRAMVNAALLGMTKEKISCNKEKCIKCGVCMRHCPKRAITLNPFPEIDTKKCIRCFCCIELCPEHALYLQDNILRKIVKKLRK